MKSMIKHLQRVKHYSLTHFVFFNFISLETVNIMEQDNLIGRCTIDIAVNEHTLSILELQPDFFSEVRRTINSLTGKKHDYSIEKLTCKESESFPFAIVVTDETDKMGIGVYSTKQLTQLFIITANGMGIPIPEDIL